MILEQAIENIDRFPHPTGNEMAEESDVRVADMVVRDAAKLAIAHMMLAQQIIPDEFNVGPIGNGRLPAAPQKRQFKPRVFFNHIAQGGLQLGGRNMLIVKPSQNLAANRPIGVTRGLGGAELTGIAKDRENVA